MRAKLVKENIEDLLVPKSKENIIKELSELGQIEKNEKLLDATWSGQLEIVKLLIEAGANINYKNEYGNTALTYASTNGYLDIVKLLIDNGANINEINLVWIRKDNKDVVELLKKHGAK